MVNRIKNPKELPKWFDIRKYDQLLDLSVWELLAQLDHRRYLYEYYPTNDFGLWEMVLSGDVILDVKSDIKSQFIKPSISSNSRLTGSDYIYPLSYEDVGELFYKATKADLYPKSDDPNEVRSRKVQEKSVSCPLNDEDKPNGIIVDINLLGGTDEEILATLRHLLPEWRKQLNIPEPNLANWRSGVSTISMIILDQIIPALDLLVWEHSVDGSITNSLLARALFPESMRDSNHVAQTVRPNIERVLSDDFFKKLYLVLSKDKSVALRKVRDHLEIYRNSGN